ncbi:MAG: hypothetical protein AB9856_14310 [Cellulosilyticaceae bacterium]
MYNLSEEGLERKRKTMIAKRGLKVRQLDYDTGEIIDTYDYLGEAAEDNYINRKAISIALKYNGGFLHSKKLRFEKIV